MLITVLLILSIVSLALLLSAERVQTEMQLALQYYHKTLALNKAENTLVLAKRRLLTMPIRWQTNSSDGYSIAPIKIEKNMVIYKITANGKEQLSRVAIVADYQLVIKKTAREVKQLTWQYYMRRENETMRMGE